MGLREIGSKIIFKFCGEKSDIEEYLPQAWFVATPAARDKNKSQSQMQSVLSNRDYCRSWAVGQSPLRLWKPHALNANSRFRVGMADFDTFLANPACWHSISELHLLAELHSVADLLAIVNRFDSTWQRVHHRAFDGVFACARAVCDSAHASTYLVVYRFNPSTYRGLAFCARLDTEVGFGARWVRECGSRHPEEMCWVYVCLWLPVPDYLCFCLARALGTLTCCCRSHATLSVSRSWWHNLMRCRRIRANVDRANASKYGRWFVCLW